MTRTTTQVWFVRLALVAAVAVGGVVATGAFAASHLRTRHTGFSVFSHHLVRAHKADASSMSAPQGAVLADVITTGGVTNELYAWHRTPQEDCLVDIEAGRELDHSVLAEFAAETKGVALSLGTQKAPAQPT